MKRGGTAPGESRKNGQDQYDLSKAYAVNPRFSKINIASPNDNKELMSNGFSRMKIN